jgi:outer membrane lipoprotein-sorting protein
MKMFMKSLFFIPVFCAFILCPGFAQSGKIDAEELLKRSDASRSGWDSYSVVTIIKNYENNDLKDEGKFEVFNKGDNKSLVKFLNADEKGEYLLVVDDAMWIYMPNTRRPIRITPMQRLMGNASNGDLARSRYYGDYSAKYLRDETVFGVPCHVLELNAKSEGATYHRIEYWISKEGARPQKSEIYLSSGKHYKSIRYDKYSPVAGRTILTQLTITEGLQPNRKTIMLFSEYKPTAIPDRYFHKDNLEQMK